LQALHADVGAEVVHGAEQPAADAQAPVVEAVALEMRAAAVGGHHVLPEPVQQAEGGLRLAGGLRQSGEAIHRRGRVQRLRPGGEGGRHALARAFPRGACRRLAFDA
jgi:hypothetical protein